MRKLLCMSVMAAVMNLEAVTNSELGTSNLTTIPENSSKFGEHHPSIAAIIGEELRAASEEFGRKTLRLSPEELNEKIETLLNSKKNPDSPEMAYSKKCTNASLYIMIKDYLKQREVAINASVEKNKCAAEYNKAKAEYDKIFAEDDRARSIKEWLFWSDAKEKWANIKMEQPDYAEEADKWIATADGYINAADIGIEKMHAVNGEDIETKRMYSEIETVFAERSKILSKLSKAVYILNREYSKLIPLILQLMPIVSDEIYNEMSRAPDQNISGEVDASNALKELLVDEKGEKIVDEVRFIDAETLINGMNLPKNRRDELIGLLLRDDEKLPRDIIEPLINDFVSKSTFVDKSRQKYLKDDLLRKRISGVLLKWANSSRTYRKLILTLIAWSEAISPKIYDLVESSHGCFSRKINFIQDHASSWYSDYNQILMNHSMDFAYNSLFGGSHQAQEDYPLFHEMGHTISGNIAKADKAFLLGMNMNVPNDPLLSMKIASNLAKIELKQDKLQKRFDVLDKITDKRAFIDFYNKMSGTGEVFQDIDGVKNYINKLTESTTGLTKLAFSHSAEILQIIGLSCLKHVTEDGKTKNVLYVNKLSDFALHIEMGWPIRCDHGGVAFFLPGAKMSKNDDFNKFANCGDPFIAKDMNRPLHEALFQAFGYDMADYEKRLEANLAVQKKQLTRLD